MQVCGINSNLTKKKMLQFSTVIMHHDGRTLESLLEELGVSKLHLAKKLGKNNNTITRWVKREKIASETLIEIGKALRFDLSHKFPRLQKLPEARELNYFNADPSQVLSEVKELKGEYKMRAELEKDVKYLEDAVETLKLVIEGQKEIIKMRDEKIADLEKRLKELE